MASMSASAMNYVDFAREWARQPLDVAAISPSSRSLARLITSRISRKTGSVLELGPGTGPFTTQLLENGVPQRNLTLIEKNARFAAILRARFPMARILDCDVTQADSATLAPDGRYGAVVSGLGLLSMKEDAVRAILEVAFAHLDKDGAFYQFTYGWRCAAPATVMRDLGLVAEPMGVVYRNLPPASVYALRRAS